MKFAVAITALSAFAASAVAQTIQIAQPPNFVTCQPGRISWTGGQAPFFLSILPGGNTAAPPLVDLGQQSENVYVWNANVSPGQDITVRISDSQGVVQYSSQIPVIAGSSTSCVGQPISGTSAGSTVAATTTGSQSAGAAGNPTSAASSAAASATSAISSVAASASASASGASSVISSAVSSARASASSVVSSVSSAVSAAASSRASSNSAATSTVAATAAATTSAANAASPQSIGGVGAVVIGAIGAVAALF